MGKRGARGILFALLLAAAAPAAALEARHLAVVVNAADPLSVAIGEYYAAKRRILFSNVIRVEFPPGRSAIGREEFARLKKAVDEQAGAHVQAYALTWAAPYRVDCMSITSAFAFGFDPAYCAQGCAPTRPSLYFNSRTRFPYARLRIRPAMAIAASSLEAAKALIDRGVLSDGMQPQGVAYLVRGGDAARSTRDPSYEEAQQALGRLLKASVVDASTLTQAPAALFYFVGRANVALDNVRFLPGAIADHLTSAGGQLTDSGQMSALRWLEAGATGSYGAVVEPCNLPQKFPHPPALIAAYLRGETLVEAYWKSVAMPGQGVFIGEPLAAPFRAGPRS